MPPKKTSVNGGDSSSSSQQSASGRSQCRCPICEELILDAVGRKPGQAAVECDGSCAAWLHRRCVGLSMAAFEVISKSSDPFFCPQCRLDKQQLEIDSLRDMVSSLSAKLSALSNHVEVQECLDGLSEVSSPIQATLGLTSYAAAASDGGRK